MNWNLLAVDANNGAERDHTLEASDRVEAAGGRLIALTVPQALNFRLSFENGVLLDQLEGWAKVMSLPDAPKLAVLRDPEARAWLEASANATQAERLQFLLDWGSAIFIDTHSPETAAFEGRRVDDVAAELGCSPFDALCHVVVADRLKTGFRTPDKGGDDEAWRQRIDVWRDERTLIGGSDAGAHLDMIDTFAYSTSMLEQAVRRRDLLPVSEAVHLITDRPARMFGLRERGRLEVGWHADITVFDLDEIGPELVTFVPDLPAGARRIHAGATGIDHVIVNGVEVLRKGEFTGDRGGIVLRSGRDTATVPARA
jgi:N-acyl-D-aspartate/D-glutamate deacylase